MKTTIDIANGLLQRAKRLAARRNTTLREIVEDALRGEFARESERTAGPGIELKTFRGRGLRSGLSWDDFGAIRDLSYEGRGG